MLPVPATLAGDSRTVRPVEPYEWASGTFALCPQRGMRGQRGASLSFLCSHWQKPQTRAGPTPLPTVPSTHIRRTAIELQ